MPTSTENRPVPPSQRSFPNAIKWAYSANWGERAFGAVFTLILAAMLGPRAFGVLSIAMAYILFLQMFLDQGFMAALIQREDLEAAHLDTVFWMDLLLSLFLVLVSISASGWWAGRNHSPEAQKLIAVLSLSIPIEALACVQGAILKREMDFKAIAIRTNVAALVGGVTGVGMAVAGAGVWALAGQQLARDLTALVLLWKLSPWRPSFRFSWKHLNDLRNFSISNFIAQLGIFADVQSAPILLGFFFGPLAVGLYRIADRLTGAVITMATTSIQSVALPEFSRLQRQPELLKKSVLNCVWLSSTATFPALAVIAASSSAILAVMGQNWLGASSTLAILCLVGMCSVFVYFTGPLMQAVAKTRQLAILEWARTAVASLFIVGAGIAVSNSGVQAQITGIAMARLLSTGCLVTPVFLWILIRISGLSLRDLVPAVAPSMAGSLCAYAAVLLLRLSPLVGGRAPFTLAAAEGSVGALTGIAVVLVLDPVLRGMVRNQFKAFDRSPATPRVVENTASQETATELSPNPDRDQTPQLSPSRDCFVSVVIPTYNRAYVIEDALASVLYQSHQNLEIIVVDDGSTDNTLELIETLNDDRVRYIRHERNKGCSAAYNTGIAAAKGEVIAFLDSDDLWHRHYLTRHVQFLSTHPEVDVSFCDTEIWVGDKVILSLIRLMRSFPRLIGSNPPGREYVISRRDMHLCLLEEIPVKPTAAVVRREALARVGVPFEESWPSGTDWDLFLRLSWVARFGYIDRPLAVQRRTADATHQKFLVQDKQFLLQVLHRERSRIGSDRDAVSAVNRGIAGIYNSLAWCYFESGQSRKALSVYLAGFKDTGESMLMEKLAAGLVRTAHRGVTSARR